MSKCRHGSTTATDMLRSASATAGNTSRSANGKTERLLTGIIRPLPHEVVAQIKSSTAIVSLVQVVLKLLENALDAGASRIEATVDFGRGGCTIEDNGFGIPPQEFREDGRLGKMYCTSKYDNLAASFGRNGTFLASLATMSLLTITSHHGEHRSHNTMTFHHGKPINRQIPAPSQHAISFSDHGTRVTVRNLFGNMPVRVKQRAMVLEEGAEHERLWDKIRKDITSLLLAWGKAVSIRLRNAANSQLLALGRQTSAISGSFDNGEKTRGRSSELSFILNTLTQASIIAFEDWDSWVPISASTRGFSIKGAISLTPAPSKHGQFLSLGIRPIEPENGQNELYDEINRLFSRSSFGIEEDSSDIDENEKIRRQKDKRFKSDGYTRRQLFGGRKGIDRWPMFSLRVKFEDEAVAAAVASEEDLLEKGINLQSLVEVLNAMITQWLSAHHFRPRTRSVHSRWPNSASPSSTSGSERGGNLPLSGTELSVGRANTAPDGCGSNVVRPKALNMSAGERKNSGVSSSSVKAPRLGQQQSFKEWSRIKSGNNRVYDTLWKSGKTREESISDVTSIAFSRFGNARSLSNPSSLSFGVQAIGQGSLSSTPPVERETRPTRQPAYPDLEATEREIFAVEERLEDDTVTWTNPATKQNFLVNARTGCVMSQTQKRPASDLQLSGATSTLGDYNKRLCLRNHPGPNRSQGSESPWLHDLLRGWENPVFKPSEQPIPQTSLLETYAYEGQGTPAEYISCGLFDFNKALGEASVSGPSTLSKTGLARAQVIAQLDRKFILVKMRQDGETALKKASNDELLVLIDQHAADERIQVESLLASLCTLSSDVPERPTYRSELGHASLVNYTLLQKPLLYIISNQESALFRTHAARFAAWGILYDIQSSPKASMSLRNERGKDEQKISITTLPRVILERAKSTPSLLLNLLRSEIWKNAENVAVGLDRQRTLQSADTSFPPTWVSRIGSCPEGLLDMVNSRACRSAIMFNDELSLKECEELVRRLATCVFPFVCAHGRPSMVPLVSLGGQDDAPVRHGESYGFGPYDIAITELSGAKQNNFVDAWTKWRVKERDNG